MWHKQSFTQFWSQSDAYSRRSSLKLTYIHHPLVVCTHQICCAVAVPIALSQDRLLHGHNRLVNWTPCSRMREQANKTNGVNNFIFLFQCIHVKERAFHTLHPHGNKRNGVNKFDCSEAICKHHHFIITIQMQSHLGIWNQWIFNLVNIFLYINGNW